MQFVATALLGKLSDRVGRRPVLLTTMLVNAVGYTLFAFAGSYWVLFLSRVVSGFAGGNISAAQAYMADITTPAERSRGMGVVGAAFGIGFSLGPAIGGFAAHFGTAAPGLVAVGLSLANFVSAYFILPESLKTELRVKRPLLDLAHIGDAVARPKLRPLMAVWAIVPLGRTAGPPLIGTVYDASAITSFVLAGAIMAIAGLAAFSLAPMAHHAKEIEEVGS